MADFECDTQRLRDDGKKVLEYTDDIVKQLDNIFSTIEDMAINGVWSGKDSNLYRSTVQYTDKRQYYKFTDGLKSIGQEMVDYSDDLENEITKNEREFDY